jgi:hypothetical protein
MQTIVNLCFRVIDITSPADDVGSSGKADMATAARTRAVLYYGWYSMPGRRSPFRLAGRDDIECPLGSNLRDDLRGLG